jgi:predicted nicotinamide N-methyase
VNTLSDGGEGHLCVVPVTPCGASSRSLWQIAVEQLSPQDRVTLAEFGIESSIQQIGSNLESIRNEVEGMLNKNRDTPWQFKFRGEIIFLRDVGRKIQQWIDKFREIGDIIIQFDPGHAALPWAAFRFLLKVLITVPCN